MKASSLALPAAAVLALTGMVWGLIMAISEDHSAMPAHAHLNLLGWVSLFLFGVFYHLHPAVDNGRLAIVQVWVWIVATVLQAIGVGLVHTGRSSGDPIAAAASIALLLDMTLFGWLVLTRHAAKAAPA